MLLVSLLGWSVWWAICNVYEFAPRLDSAALVCAWLAAAMAAAGGLLARPGSGWLLAGLNGAYLLAVHRQFDAGLGTPLFGALVVLVFCLVLSYRHKRKRPASLPAV